MAKRSKGLSPGVHWIPGEEGWIPRFVWRKTLVEGPPRPAKAFLPGEPFRVVMEFANLSGKAIFGVSPYHTVEDGGREVFKPNPAFDEIPDMKALLGGLSKPKDIEIVDRSKPSLETPDGIPVDQIDPETLPTGEIYEGPVGPVGIPGPKGPDKFGNEESEEEFAERVRKAKEHNRKFYENKNKQ